MSIVFIDQERCRGSFRCVRTCPVNAIRIHGLKAEIISEKCIECGSCLAACAQKAISARSDVNAVRQMLATDRVVAILAPEYVAALHPATPEQVVAGLERLGFYSVEETVLGEELIAVEYARMLDHLNGQPFIRSTCPAVVSWIERYRPEFVAHLAPLISPMIAQGRLVKAIYDTPVRTVYVGPCVARKSEALQPQVSDAIDAVLTFAELKQFFREQYIDVESLPAVADETHRPMLCKAASLIDGFPRDVLARSSMVDTDVRVVRGSGAISELAEAVEEGQTRPRVVDLLHCDGCIDGPGMGIDTSPFARKNLVSAHYDCRRRASDASVSFGDLKPRLPRIATARGFSPDPVVERTPTAEELASILAQAEKRAPEDELDCGACGYDTCHEQALAISRGLAEWENCYPFQKKLLGRLVDRLRELSVTDGLTGLVNHRTFNERLQEELSRFRRYGNPVAVLMIDIDLFKQVNDSLGHVCGDSVLRAIAAMLSENVRGSDVVGRWGGDEFSVILPESDKTQAFAVAEKLRARVQETPITVSDGERGKVLNMTISIGVGAGDSDPEITADQLVTDADRALYRAKTRGRNRTEIGTSGADDASEEPKER